MESSFFISTQLVFLALAITLTTHHHRHSSFCAAEFFPTPFSIPPALNTTAGPWDGFNSFSGSRAGQSYDGLAQLKKYFNYFGYMPAAPGNFSDEFDDSLESAIRLYQRNFRLNVTGQLDDDMLQHIVQPRCGVADIINGTNSMANRTASPQLRIVAHYTVFDGQPRWPSDKRDLTYAFLKENQFDVDVRHVFASAFARWAAVVPFSFTGIDDYSVADITIAAYSGDHGDAAPFDGALGTLAHASAPTDGRLHLDNDESWVVTGDVSRSPVNTAVDLESVAVHEIGHLLGLNHSADVDSVMHPTLRALTRKVELSDDDVEGAQSLYGSRPDYKATGRRSEPFNTVSGASSVGEFGGWWLLSRWPGCLLGLAAAVALHRLIPQNSSSQHLTKFDEV